MEKRTFKLANGASYFVFLVFPCGTLHSLKFCWSHTSTMPIISSSTYGLQDTLEQGYGKIDGIVMSQTDLGLSDRSMVWKTDLMEAMELENLLINSSITMHSAEQRKESRGGHACEDWLKHTLGNFDHLTESKVPPPSPETSSRLIGARWGHNVPSTYVS